MVFVSPPMIVFLEILPTPVIELLTPPIMAPSAAFPKEFWQPDSTQSLVLPVNELPWPPNITDLSLLVPYRVLKLPSRNDQSTTPPVIVLLNPPIITDLILPSPDVVLSSPLISITSL